MNRGQRHNLPGPHPAGFTLLELLLAMSMAALLALALYEAMHIAIKARRTATAAVNFSHQATIAIDLIAQDLASVQPQNTSALNAGTFTFFGPFQGAHQTGPGGADSDFISFYTIRSQRTGNDSPLSEGACYVDWTLRTDTNPPELVRHVTRNLLSPVQQAPQEQVICRGVRSFSVRYFDTADATWITDWDTLNQNPASTLPKAVEVTIEMQAPDNPQATAESNAARPRRTTRIVPLSCGQ